MNISWGLQGGFSPLSFKRKAFGYLLAALAVFSFAACLCPVGYVL